jgi:hypothetical protein
MTQSNMIDRSDAPRSYGFKVTLATLSASVAAGAFWASQNPQIARHDLWQDGAIAAGLLALLLTRSATNRPPRRSPEPSTRQASRPSLVHAGLDAASTLRSQLVEAGKAQAAKALDAKEAPKPKPNVLEGERDRLRKAGFSDQEISQILVARETAGQPAAVGLGSGLMTGVLNNLSAVSAHARNIIPSLKADLAHLLDGEASAAERLGAAVTLAFKAAVIAVLAYVVSLEFSQLQSAARKAHAEACIARQQAEINFSTMSELASGRRSSLDDECRTQ